jgi:hypothetical protein
VPWHRAWERSGSLLLCPRRRLRRWWRSSNLAGERGLAAVTVRRCVRFARLLITGLGISGEADLAAVTAR